MGTILTCDIEHSLNMYYLRTPIPKRFVSIPITKSYYAVGFSYANLWNERFEEIIEGLITGGIVNFHLEKYTKSKWNLMSQDSESEKVVLNMSHLGFGFQICFFALFATFLVFCVERAVKFKCEKPEKNEFSDKGIEYKSETVVVVATSVVLLLHIDLRFKRKWLKMMKNLHSKAMSPRESYFQTKNIQK